MGIQDVLSHNLTCAFRASSGLINYMSLPSNDSVLLCIPKFMVWWDRHYPVHDRVLRTNGNLVARGKHSVSTKTQQEAKSGFSKDQLSLGDGKALPKILKNCAVIHLQEAAKQHLYLPLTLKHHWIFKGMEKKGKEEERGAEGKKDKRKEDIEGKKKVILSYGQASVADFVSQAAVTSSGFQCNYPRPKVCWTQWLDYSYSFFQLHCCKAKCSLHVLS